MDEYDAVIIGGGPSGYTAAIRIAQLGGKVCLVEKNKLGVVCVNTGCIPTKILVDSAKKIKDARKIGEIKVDFSKIKEKIAKAVEDSRKGVEYLLKKKNIEIIYGIGSIFEREVRVNNRILKTDNVIVATGGKARKIFENSLTNNEIFSLQEIPENLTIIGGGYIGMEFASIFSNLGSKVKLIEIEGRVLNSEEPEIAKEIMRLLNVEFELGKKVDSVTGIVLEATGIIPVFDKLVMDRLGVKYDKGIITDNKMKTNISWLYAIGDVNGKFPVAHVAIKEAVVAAENIMGMDSVMNYDEIPNCIFTIPEIASVGRKEGVSGKFPFAANGKARISGNTEGFVKIYLSQGKLVGASIIGTDASSLIAVVQGLLGKTVPEIKKIVIAHPTLPEAVIEAVLQANNEEINL